LINVHAQLLACFSSSSAEGVTYFCLKLLSVFAPTHQHDVIIFCIRSALKKKIIIPWNLIAEGISIRHFSSYILLHNTLLLLVDKEDTNKRSQSVIRVSAEKHELESCYHVVDRDFVISDSA